MRRPLQYAMPSMDLASPTCRFEVRDMPETVP